MSFIPPFPRFHRPFFDAASSKKKNMFQEHAEDVDFEGVKESAKKQPKIDELARAKQLAKAAEEVGKKYFEQDPMFGMLVVSTFITGARWADEHPASSYGNKSDWRLALRDEIDRLQTMVHDNGSKDILFEIAITTLFLNGASWANDNPAPTL